MDNWREELPVDCKFNKMTPIIDEIKVKVKRSTPSTIRAVSVNGVKYSCSGEAGVALGVAGGDIEARIDSKAFAYVGYVYLEEAI